MKLLAVTLIVILFVGGCLWFAWTTPHVTRQAQIHEVGSVTSIRNAYQAPSSFQVAWSKAPPQIKLLLGATFTFMVILIGINILFRK